MSIYLVEGPQAETFMTMAATETGSKAMLGKVCRTLEVGRQM